MDQCFATTQTSAERVMETTTDNIVWPDYAQPPPPPPPPPQLLPTQASIPPQRVADANALVTFYNQVEARIFSVENELKLLRNALYETVKAYVEGEKLNFEGLEFSSTNQVESEENQSTDLLQSAVDSAGIEPSAFIACNANQPTLPDHKQQQQLPSDNNSNSFTVPDLNTQQQQNGGLEASVYPQQQVGVVDAPTVDVKALIQKRILELSDGGKESDLKQSALVKYIKEALSRQNFTAVSDEELKKLVKEEKKRLESTKERDEACKEKKRRSPAFTAEELKIIDKVTRNMLDTNPKMPRMDMAKEIARIFDEKRRKGYANFHARELSQITYRLSKHLPVKRSSSESEDNAGTEKDAKKAKKSRKEKKSDESSNKKKTKDCKA